MATSTVDDWLTTYNANDTATKSQAEIKKLEEERKNLEASFGAEYNKRLAAEGSEAAEAYKQETSSRVQEIDSQLATHKEALADANNTLGKNEDGSDKDINQVAKDQKSVADTTKNVIGALGDTFGGYMHNALSQRLAQSAVDPSGMSASARRIAEIKEQGAAEQDKFAQQSAQIANRNYRDEADKNAAAQASQENQQKVSNMGNASAGAAALERGTATADYDTHMNRADTQREKAAQLKGAANATRQSAERNRQEAKELDYKAGLTQQRNAEVGYVNRARGGGYQDGSNPPDGGRDGNPPDGGRDGNPPVVQEDERQLSNGGKFQPQNVINYLLGSTTRRKNGVEYEPGTEGYDAVKNEADALVPMVLQDFISQMPEYANVQQSLGTPLARVENEDIRAAEARYVREKQQAGADFMKWLKYDKQGRTGPIATSKATLNAEAEGGDGFNQSTAGSNNSSSAVRALAELHEGATGGV